MSERRLPLDRSVLDLHDAMQELQGDNRQLATALSDWFQIGGSVSTIRICLADSNQNSLSAALIVLDAALVLANGQTARLDSRLLAEGGVDVDGREGASPAVELVIPRLPRGAQTALAAAKASNEVSAAARLSRNGDAAVMLVGIAPHPIRARQIESVVRGRSLDDRIVDLAAQTARSEAQPYGVGDLTDVAAISQVEDAARRLFRRLRDRFDSDELSKTPAGARTAPYDRRRTARRR